MAQKTAFVLSSNVKVTRTVRPVGSTVALLLRFRENRVHRGWGGAILKSFGSQWVRLGGIPRRDSRKTLRDS